MIELTFFNVRKHFGSNRVLFDASFKVYEGDKVGIVGANGSGKSTILKILAGIETIDIDYRKICEGKSRILVNKGTTIGYLEQLPNYPDTYKVIDVLNIAFQELRNMEEQMAEMESSMGLLQGEELDLTIKRYGQLQQRYIAKGGYDRDELLSKVCIGLKFDDAFLKKDFLKLSGGEKTSVMLGKILLESPDIMLLDEPTNHLDMDAVEWLENYLKSYRGMVIIVSHDRYFLDNVVTKIVEVENKQCETFLGNYSDYIKQKEENMFLQYENYKEQQKKANAMEKAINDLRDWAQRADNKKFFRRAVSMQRKLDKMERIDKPVFDKQNIKVNFKFTEKSGYEIINVRGLTKRFDNRIIFDNADLYVTCGEKVAIIGPNGCGKTSLIKMLLGEMSVDAGIASLGANVKVSYLQQNVSFKNEENTVIECFRENRYILEGKAREYLAKFMFFGSDPFKKVKHLSGGERVRLKLSMLLYEETSLLIFDEPTNHLDIDSIEVLEEAMEDFKGTILFVSHDRYFINKVCNRVVAVEDSKFANYLGNYDYYKNKKNELNQVQPQAVKKNNEIKDMIITVDKGTDNHRTELERSIKILENEVKEVDNSMNVPGINHEELSKLYSKREDLNVKLDKLIEQWTLSF